MAKVSPKALDLVERFLFVEPTLRIFVDRGSHPCRSRNLCRRLLTFNVRGHLLIRPLHTDSGSREKLQSINLLMRVVAKEFTPKATLKSK